MEVKNIFPPVHSFLQVKLDQISIDYLWKIINIARTKNLNFNDKLIGNISQSLLLDDLDSYFYNSVCVPLVKYYRKNNPLGIDPVSQNSSLENKTRIELHKFWVNYQYKTEFNPYHEHNGVYSFAIWMKIPYAWEDQKKLPQFNNNNDKNIKAGNFEFEYIDILGDVNNLGYKLSPNYEGFMLFFPSRLRHCVYPFYDSNEPRISISGNLSYVPF
tara:strand:- start:483 stop:1127 length:645 start_codon:yes stop_codon:yes gene_type:complete